MQDELLPSHPAFQEDLFGHYVIQNAGPYGVRANRTLLKFLIYGGDEKFIWIALSSHPKGMQRWIQVGLPGVPKLWCHHREGHLPGALLTNCASVRGVTRRNFSPAYLDGQIGSRLERQSLRCALPSAIPSLINNNRGMETDGKCAQMLTGVLAA